MREIDLLMMEPESDDAVMRWRHTFDRDTCMRMDIPEGQEFTYVAVKADGRYFITGRAGSRNPEGFTWSELVKLPMCEALRKGDFEVASDWS